MHKKMRVDKQGDIYHVACLDYMGRYEGKSIGERLDLQEVPPPPGGPDENGLKLDQFYMWHPMERHPELHALVPADKLRGVAEVARDMHMEVVEGEELLPRVADIETHHKESYVAVIEERHKSIWERGWKEVLKAFLVRAVPAIVVLGLLVLVFRHVGDHHQNVTLSTVFLRASSPPVEQSFWDGLINPSHDHQVRVQVRGVRFLDRNRMIFADGNFVRVDGVDELRPLFDLARKRQMAPSLEATIGGGLIAIDRIVCDDETFMENGDLVRIARFEPSANEPRRSAREEPHAFNQIQALPYDEAEVLKTWTGKRTALVGHLVDEGGKTVLRFANGGGVVLKPVLHKPLAHLIDTFTGDPAEVQVDVILEQVYPWTDKKNPERARDDTKLIGEANVFSASAQNFHVIARR